MTYNNNYYPQPCGYTPIATPTVNYTMPTQQRNYNNNGINWVQGEAAARAYQVGPGEKVLLLDLEKDVFYIKTVDASGMPAPLRIFEYKEILPDAPKNISQVGQDNNQFVTKQELDERLAQIEELLK